jgi:hypothetical protein
VNATSGPAFLRILRGSLGPIETWRGGTSRAEVGSAVARHHLGSLVIIWMGLPCNSAGRCSFLCGPCCPGRHSIHPARHSSTGRGRRFRRPPRSALIDRTRNRQKRKPAPRAGFFGPSKGKHCSECSPFAILAMGPMLFSAGPVHVKQQQDSCHDGGNFAAVSSNAVGAADYTRRLRGGALPRWITRKAFLTSARKKFQRDTRQLA